MATETRKRIVIMGAAGRDFHNFNQVYRDDASVEVKAFTATQIPGIERREYPRSLSGPNHPNGIPIIAEAELGAFCKANKVAEVIFAYSDVAHADVMHKASIVLATGANFVLLGMDRTAITAKVPVIAVSAVRTGCGKSQTCRWIATRLKNIGLQVAAIRHPMPYGDLTTQSVQRFATRADLSRANCTVEEREEYEPYIDRGLVVFAGVEYEKIIELAEREVDIILWDGGNNDFPFLHPDLHIVLVDPLRAGDELGYHPGEATLRMADIILVAKANAASVADIAKVSQSARSVNGHAQIIRGDSVVSLSDIKAVQHKRVLVVEDGPTTTHGGMSFGAGYVAALQAPAKQIVDPRLGATPAIRSVFDRYPHLEHTLPALGYFPEQLAELEKSINNIDADVVVAATPCDLSKLLVSNKPIVRVAYEYAEAEEPGLGAAIDRFLKKVGLS